MKKSLCYLVFFVFGLSLLISQNIKAAEDVDGDGAINIEAIMTQNFTESSSSTQLEGYNIIVVGGYYGDYTRLRSLGATVLLANPGDITSELIYQYDLLWVSLGRSHGVSSKAEIIQDYIRNGGGLILEQPNYPGNVSVLPYTFNISSIDYDGECARNVLNPDHELVKGLNSDQLPACYDTVGEIGSEWEILVEDATGDPSLSVATYGEGRIIVELGNTSTHSSCVCGICMEDIIIERMVKWVSGAGGSPENVPDLAKGVIGTNYQWGGKGYDLNEKLFVATKKINEEGYYFWNPMLGVNGKRDFGTGIDCSGLSFWTYNRTYSGGEKISWNDCIAQKKCPVYYEGADGQYRGNTIRINKEELEPGDLLFFSTKKSGVMDHVGMYVGLFTYEGNYYNVIHASGFAGHVTPATYYLSTDKVKTVRGDAQEQFLDVAAYRRISEFRLEMEIIAHSPINLIVTDPNGQTVTIENTFPDDNGNTQEVPGLYYIVRDINGSGELNDIVAIPELILGSYLINPVPKPDALPMDTYSLEVIANGVSKFLAENIPVSNIPSMGYGIEVTESEIFQFIPTSIDIKPGSDPNCFNNNGNGVIPVAIVGKADFDVRNVDPGTVKLEGLAIRVVGKSNKLLAHYEDVNSDGYEDLVVQIEDIDGAFKEGTTSASVTGNLFDGTQIKGTDSICIVP